MAPNNLFAHRARVVSAMGLPCLSDSRARAGLVQVVVPHCTVGVVESPTPRPMGPCLSSLSSILFFCFFDSSDPLLYLERFLPSLINSLSFPHISYISFILYTTNMTSPNVSEPEFEQAYKGMSMPLSHS
jgi:hypothetical protein